MNFKLRKNANKLKLTRNLNDYNFHQSIPLIEYQQIINSSISILI
jgi:hypothetical protein